jgi:protoporphyrinogen oxidase
VPPSTLDVEFGRERLPPLSLRNVLLGIKPKGGFHQEDPAWTTRYYPKHGVYQLCEAILARLRERKVRLVTEAEISEIVEEQDGIRLRLKEVELKADYVVSSIPLPALMAVHRDLAKVDLGRVKYRGIGFVYLSVPADIVLPVATVYCADANMGFNRISDFSLFSRDVCPPGKNILCVEFNLDDEDGSTLKEQGQRILGQLKESGILDLSVIHSVHFETASTVYPIYLKGYREQVLKFFQSSLRQQRLLCFGRQGLFAYNNIDQVILSAFEASEVIVSSPFDRNLKRAYYVGRKRIEHQPDVMLQEDAVE